MARIGLLFPSWFRVERKHSVGIDGQMFGPKKSHHKYRERRIGSSSSLKAQALPHDEYLARNTLSPRCDDTCGSKITTLPRDMLYIVWGLQ
jgi:hypothetical protein